MVWQGFLIESKKYMNHPDYWPEWNVRKYDPEGWTMKDKRKAAFSFWCGFLRAALRFYFFTIREFVVRRLL